jgi:hypothetical protein
MRACAVRRLAGALGIVVLVLAAMGVRVSQLVFNGQPANVEWVFVAGRALKHPGRDDPAEGRIIAEAEAASERVQRLLGLRAPK